MFNRWPFDYNLFPAVANGNSYLFITFFIVAIFLALQLFSWVRIVYGNPGDTSSRFKIFFYFYLPGIVAVISALWIIITWLYAGITAENGDIRGPITFIIYLIFLIPGTLIISITCFFVLAITHTMGTLFLGILLAITFHNYVNGIPSDGVVIFDFSAYLLSEVYPISGTALATISFVGNITSFYTQSE